MFELDAYRQKEPLGDQRNLVLKKRVEELKSSVRGIHRHRQAPSNAVGRISVTHSPDDVLPATEGDLVTVVQIVGIPELRIQWVGTTSSGEWVTDIRPTALE